MAVFKPSNFYPNMEEIDITTDNTFSCQVNTSGENVTAYKIQILLGDSSLISGGSSEPILLKNPVKNKKILNITGINQNLPLTLSAGTAYYSTPVFSPSTFVGYLESPVSYTTGAPTPQAVQFTLNNITYYARYPEYNQVPLSNKKDYQWGVRVYNATKDGEEQPNTLVCSGFLVGSTKSVIWCNIPYSTMYKSSINDLENSNLPSEQVDYLTKARENITVNRYIELEVDSNDQLIIGAHEAREKSFPFPNGKPVSSDNHFKVRKKIDFVTQELGENKDYCKIEVDQPFEYDYVDGTPFTIFRCDNKHTVNSFFADPNTEVNLSDYVVIFENVETATAAAQQKWDPSQAPISGLKYGAKKPTGYSSDTGEFRFHESYSQAPEDGNVYMLFTYDSVTSTYTEIPPEDGNYESQKIGGNPIQFNYYTVAGNVWNEDKHRIFIQPNTAIGEDYRYFDEIVFENGARVNITPQYWINENTPSLRMDMTFNKLDNSQWVIGDYKESLYTISNLGYIVPLHENVSGLVPFVQGTSEVPTISQTDYQVYSSFADSSPLSYFYARKNPTISIDLYNYLIDQSTPTQGEVINYGNVKFVGKFEAEDGQNIKYYYYQLYHNNTLIKESDSFYSNDLTWVYRGLKEGEIYCIKLHIVDNYNKSFVVERTFECDYEFAEENGEISVDWDCKEKAFKIKANAPLSGFSSNPEEAETLEIPVGTYYYSDPRMEETVGVVTTSGCVGTWNEERSYLTFKKSSNTYYVKPFTRGTTVTNIEDSQTSSLTDSLVELRLGQQELASYSLALGDNNVNHIEPLDFGENNYILAKVRLTKEFIESIPTATYGKEILRFKFKEDNYAISISSSLIVSPNGMHFYLYKVGASDPYNTYLCSRAYQIQPLMSPETRYVGQTSDTPIDTDSYGIAASEADFPMRNPDVPSGGSTAYQLSSGKYWVDNENSVYNTSIVSQNLEVINNTYLYIYIYPKDGETNGFKVEFAGESIEQEEAHE